VIKGAGAGLGYIVLTDNGSTPQTVTKTVSVTTDWQFVSVTITASAGSTTVKPAFYFPNSAPVSFWIDALMVAEGPFSTSWVDGARAADLLGIVPLHNLLRWSEDLTQASAWVTGSSMAITKAGGDNTLTLVSANSEVIQASGATNVAGKTYTAAVRVKLGTLSGNIRIQLIDQSNLIAQTQIFTSALSASEYRTFYVTGTMGSSATQARVKLIGQSGSGTVLVESVRLLEGSHPGIYVPTTDAPILPPPSPVLDPAWSQNGRVRFTGIFPDVNVNGRNFGLFGGFGGFGATPDLCLWKYDTWGQYRNISFSRRDSSGVLRHLQPAPTTDLADGTPHDVELEWTNEISEATGVRQMWMRIYIDGVKVAEQDVAALYGATAWAPLDASRLISDGSVHAVLSRIALDYPTPRAGWRQVTQ
jgi:hypothetical protein